MRTRSGSDLAGFTESLPLPVPISMTKKEWNDTGIPLAYLITFRCYGTWLHGDARGWVKWGELGIKPPDARVRHEQLRVRSQIEIIHPIDLHEGDPLVRVA